MILKGSQRSNGADLAIHLMNGFDNESVEIARVDGAVASDPSSKPWRWARVRKSRFTACRSILPRR